MKEIAVEALRQLIEGEDFASPRGLLKSIDAELATKVSDSVPYSIATNVKHASIWQDHWLGQITGRKAGRIAYGKDFPPVTAEEWPDVRRDFLNGLEIALEIAKRDPFAHQLASDSEAVCLLMKIVNHGAYHMGQFSLLKRMLRRNEDFDRAVIRKPIP